jgi:hypothetical protein
LKNLCIFHHFEKSLHFSPLWKIFMLFTWAGCPLQQDHFKKFLYFSPLWKISVFFTSLKNLCIFHLGRSPITIRPPQKTFFFQFSLGRSPMTIRPLQNLWILKRKIFQFLLWVHFLSLKRIHHFLIWWVHHLSFFFFLYNAYYLKSLTRLSTVSIVKRGATVITQFWVIPQKSPFFKIKINKIK